MISNQLKSRGIDNINVLNAMQTVPRELFVPREVKDQAYSDRALPIGYDQTISQPYIVAFMTQVLNPKAESKVLEIGTGSGYQAAVLSKMCYKVYTIEIIKELALRAAGLFTTLSYSNIQLRIGDGSQGWSEKSPFDVILVTAAAAAIPPCLIDQLRVGGKIILPLEKDHKQILVLGTKVNNNTLEKEELMPVVFVPMISSF